MTMKEEFEKYRDQKLSEMNDAFDKYKSDPFHGSLLFEVIDLEDAICEEEGQANANCRSCGPITFSSDCKNCTKNEFYANSPALKSLEKRIPHGRCSPGFLSRKEVDDLKKHIQPGDRVWAHSSPPEFWKALAGQAGYWLIRGNEIIRCYLHVEN